MGPADREGGPQVGPTAPAVLAPADLMVPVVVPVGLAAQAMAEGLAVNAAPAARTEVAAPLGLPIRRGSLSTRWSSMRTGMACSAARSSSSLPSRWGRLPGLDPAAAGTGAQLPGLLRVGLDPRVIARNDPAGLPLLSERSR